MSASFNEEFLASAKQNYSESRHLLAHTAPHRSQFIDDATNTISWSSNIAVIITIIVVVKIGQLKNN